jgi:hypothetical protein
MSAAISAAIRNAERLERAAEILTETARTIFDCHTLGGEWILDSQIDRHAKEDHDEMIRLARHLRKSAKSADEKLLNHSATQPEGVIPCHNQTWKKSIARS